MSLSWTQPTCEACWIAQHSEYDTNDMVVAVDKPVMVKEVQLERCAFCGAPTIVGIYTRADPATVTYPREKNE
jgi:hypothetical protein